MKIKKYSVIIYAVFLLLLSVSFVVYLFPKEKQFQYSFSAGNPWLHEDLMASFDFPIYKTSEEVASEKDSIKNSFIPFYIKDSSTSKISILSFNTGAEKVFKNEIIEIANESGLFNFRKKTNQKSFETFIDDASVYISEVYNKGLIQIPDSASNIDGYRFYLIENGLSELRFSTTYNKTRSIKSDFQQFYESTDVYQLDSLAGFPLLAYIKDFNFKANIVYDHNLNNELLNNQIASLSPTLGIVQKGELIISKGAIVGDYENKVLLSLKKETENDNSDVNHFLITLGIILLFSVLYLVVFLYLYLLNKDIIYSFKANTFFTMQMMLLISSVILLFSYTDLSVNVVPYALIPLLLLTFYGFNVSFVIYFASILVAGFFAPNSFEFVFTQLLVGLVAMFSLRNTLKRKQIFISMLLVFLTYVVLYFGFLLMKQGDLSNFVFADLYVYGISSLLILLYLPIVFLYERMFGFLSDFTLMELSDTNNTALKILAEKAPGTFQHSIQVANLVESVVRDLGGNHLLARTGALYHDIGKSVNPEYFIENQSGANIHDNLDFEESANRIISHVNHGKELAKKYNIPHQLVDFITMHHGTSVTRYFYNSWINANPNSTPIIKNFSYPGPKPHSIETAVMMMADAIEAASRTLKVYTPETIETIVSAIIDSQLKDGQYDDVDITLKQITKAKAIFTAKIGTIYHARISYPEINEKKSD